MNGWKPIETAPEGPHILLWWPFFGIPTTGRIRDGNLLRGAPIIKEMERGSWEHVFPLWAEIPEMKEQNGDGT